MRSSFSSRSLHLEVGNTCGMRTAVEGPLRRRRRPLLHTWRKGGHVSECTMPTSGMDRPMEPHARQSLLYSKRREESKNMLLGHYRSPTASRFDRPSSECTMTLSPVASTRSMGSASSKRTYRTAGRGSNFFFLAFSSFLFWSPCPGCVVRGLPRSISTKGQPKRARIDRNKTKHSPAPPEAASRRACPAPWSTGTI